MTSLVQTYIYKEDWRGTENANSGYSYPSLVNYVAGAEIAKDTLKRYPEHISAAHVDGDIHIHDLANGIVGYCAGWSLMNLLIQGLTGGAGKPRSLPAKHLNSALQQLANFLTLTQGEWAGAQAVSSFDTLLAPFVWKDGLTYEQVRQHIQNFIFWMNNGHRLGQTVFSNVTLDWTVPEDLKDTPAVLGGEPHATRTYKDFQNEMDLINRAFLEVMSAGDADGRVFTFPIPTYNITKEFNWDSENARLLFEVTGKYGLPYFQNFVNSDLKPSDVRSLCCRLRLDIKELRHKTGGLFGSGESTGSVGVCTLNMPRIGYLAMDEADFFLQLDTLLGICKEALEIKREIVKDNFDRGLMPYSRVYLPGLDNHFSTIGVIGMHECCRNFLEKGIETPEGKAFSIRVLQHINDRLREFQEDTGTLYNLEGVPGEGTTYRLAKADVQRYPGIITAGTREIPYYTNSSHLPVNAADNIFEALKHQDELQCCYTGGTILHGYIGERIEDPEVVANLVKKIAYNFRLPYFTITPTFSICPIHGYISGEHETCPYDD